jgi:hypothetical protein
MIESIPWDWQAWGEYRTSVEQRLSLPVNVAA